MTVRIWLKLAAFLVPAIAALLFMSWWLDPAKKILRHADAVFATVQRGGIALQGIEEKTARLHDLAAPSFTIAGPDPVPNGTITRAEGGRLLAEFHESILSCAVSRQDPTVAFPSKDVALLTCKLRVIINPGGGARRDQSYRCRMEYQRSGRQWLLTGLVLAPL